MYRIIFKCKFLSCTSLKTCKQKVQTKQMLWLSSFLGEVHEEYVKQWEVLHPLPSVIHPEIIPKLSRSWSILFLQQSTLQAPLLIQLCFPLLLWLTTMQNFCLRSLSLPSLFLENFEALFCSAWNPFRKASRILITAGYGLFAHTLDTEKILRD